MKLATVVIYTEAYSAMRRVQLKSLQKFLPSWDHREIRADLVDRKGESLERFIASHRPQAVLNLFAEGYDGVLFLGTDVVFYSHASRHLNEIATSYSAMLTPHCYTQVPDDGLHPSRRDFLKAGQFNADFALWSKDSSTINFLEFQAESMKTQCSTDTFWDQGWLAFAVSYIPNLEITQHRGYNAAYYNMHERPVTVRGGKYYAGSYPLVAYHFTGWVGPHTPSRHQNRYSTMPPGMQQLYDEYAKALADATAS